MTFEPWQLDIALWGAATGTIGVVLGVLNYRAQRQRDRRSLRVEAKICPIRDKRTGRSRQGVMIRVENIGHRSVHVDQIDFLVWRRGARIDDPALLSDPPIPSELTSGKGLTACVEIHGFAQTLADMGLQGSVWLRPRCVDGVTTEYFGRAFKFDIARWRLPL